MNGDSREVDRNRKQPIKFHGKNIACKEWQVSGKMLSVNRGRVSKFPTQRTLFP